MKIHYQTDRFILRDLAPEDAEGIFALDSDPLVHKYLGNNSLTKRTQADEVIAMIQNQYVKNGIGRWGALKYLKTYAAILILFLFVGCGGTTQNEEKSELGLSLSIQKKSGKAFIIGKSVNLLNDNLEVVKLVPLATVVDILGRSDSLFWPTDEYCDAFHYVKIGLDNEQYFVDGRRVYGLNENDVLAELSLKGEDYQLLSTQYFGIGVSDSNGLTFCDSFYQPVVMMNKNSGKIGLIQNQKHEVLEKASINPKFRYLEFRADDGAYDEVESTRTQVNGWNIKIKRSHQEGENYLYLELWEGLEPIPWHSNFTYVSEIEYPSHNNYK